jgi:OOP family OmpA-OmpF porin
MKRAVKLLVVCGLAWFHAGYSFAETPAGTPPDVPAVDSDRDGVPGQRDQCPDTPANSNVDSRGCLVSLILKVQFDQGRASVKPGSLPELEQFAEYLKQHPGERAEIRGHTDKQGSPAKNQKLSQARAKAVRKALIEKFGIAPGRLTSKGYGSSKPVASNKTAAGREKNRRIEAVIRK